ncbi:peptidoglycan-binding protein [Rhizobium sp. SAFR-030]|uniref:peptidoglycan-binding protein n=1 Tax=Rhizobium sp. SAFR-030 TaxID=3387277 RepID=UPI003F7EEDEA
MNGSRLHSQPRGDGSSLDALNRTIEGLEARIEGLLKASGRQPRSPSERVAEATRHLDRKTAPVDDKPLLIDTDMLEEIRQRQRLLDAQREPVRRDVPVDPQPAPAAQSNPIVPPRPPAEPRRAPPAATNVRPPYAEPHVFATRATQPQPQPAVHDIARALAELRQELKRDISDSIAREMQTLRGDIHSIRDISGDGHLTQDLREELVRLAEGVDGLSRRAPSGAADLRADLDELRQMIDGLATRDSIQHMEVRWDALEDRFLDLDTGSIQKELIALAYRIDGMKAELGTMADSPALRTLEDKVLMLAAAVEELNARPGAGQDPYTDHFSQLDQRLDEISRAVAVSGRSRSSELEEQALLRRLEERIAGLTDRLDGLSQVQDAHRLEERLDELAANLMQGSQAELTGYLADLSRKIDALAGEQGQDLGERLDALTRRIDDLAYLPSPADGSTHGGFGRLEVRLDEIAARLDEASLGPQGDNQSIRNLEKQIAHLSTLLSEPRHEGGLALPSDLDERMASIETYMATSDEYILEAARHAAESVIETYARNGQAGGMTGPDAATFVGLAEDLRHLEALARNTDERTQATFDGVHRTLVKIAERLDTMEHHFVPRAGSMLSAQTRDRQPAPPAMAPMAATAAVDTAADPRGVLARANDELMSETAVNLELLETEHPSHAEPEPARKGLLGGLTKRLRPGAKADAPKPARAVVQPTPSIDPAGVLDVEPAEGNGNENELLEPGSGMPDVRKILERVRASQAMNGQGATAAMQDDDGERVDYIAAARRAAKAAAQETEPTRAIPVDPAVRQERGAKGKAASRLPQPQAAGLQGVLARHRRPILMAVGAILLAMMAMPLVSTLTRGDKTAPAAASNTQTPAVAPKVAAPETSEASPAAVQQPTTTAASTDAEQAPTSTAAPVGAVAMAPLAATADPLAAEPGAAAEATATAGTDLAAGDSIANAPAIEIPATIAPKSLSDAAAKGDAQALFEIGSRFTEGRGVTTDLAQAAHWYQLASDRGFSPAKYRLGNLYEKGTGVARDLPKAAGLYEEAARAGNASSMHNLAVLYASGATGTANYKAAVEWFSKAADLGVADSQFNLAILYARGNGTAQNLEESYKWFAIAAKGGDKDAAQKRDEVANALKPEQLQSARAKVEQWKAQPLDDRSNSVNLPDEWVGKSLTTASIDMEKAIRNIQAILNRNGYEAGTADGMMGKKTVMAIKAFQKKNGLAEDGTISEPLVRKLLEQNEAKGA